MIFFGKNREQTKFSQTETVYRSIEFFFVTGNMTFRDNNMDRDEDRTSNTMHLPGRDQLVPFL